LYCILTLQLDNESELGKADFKVREKHDPRNMNFKNYTIRNLQIPGMDITILLYFCGRGEKIIFADCVVCRLLISRTPVIVNILWFYETKC